jgi:hypothetical protein
MEAMDRRLNEPGQQGQEGQQGQGQEGQQGQGEEGQQGQGQQGQGQQGGQQGQGGDNPGGNGGNDGRAGDRITDSRSGGATRGDPRRLTNEEIRQYQSEFRERADQVRDLRDQLTEAGRPTEDLSQVLEAMRRFQEEGIYADPSALADLHDEMLNRLKRLEFGLRRDVEGEADRRATLTGSDEVPDGYRRLVEEYYRALARGGSRPRGN